MLHIAKGIRQAQAIANKTNNEIAKEIDVTPFTISQWKNGKTAPTLVKANDYAIACGFTIKQLIDLMAAD